MKTRTMKVLDHPRLAKIAKTALEDITSLDLQRGMYDNVDSLSDCPNLHSLFLSRNNLVTFNLDARKLWKVDLSHNALTAVGTLANYAALGFLDLSHNDLGPHELSKLRGIHIVSLRAAANPELAKLPHYRATLIWLLPDVWVLDDHFVTWREREEAQVLFTLGEAKDSPLHELDGRGGDMVWRSSSEASDNVGRLLHALTQEPMRPPLRDRFRLQRLLHVFNDQHVREVDFLNSSAADGAGFKGRGRDEEHRKTGNAHSILDDADLLTVAQAEGAVAGAAAAATAVDGGGTQRPRDIFSTLARQHVGAASFLKWTPPTHTEAIGQRRLTEREQVRSVLIGVCVVCGALVCVCLCKLRAFLVGWLVGWSATGRRGGHAVLRGLRVIGRLCIGFLLQVDLIMLLNSIHEFGVPRGLVAQALAVHLGGRLLGNVMQELTAHPECVFRANAFHVRFSNIEARDAAVGAGPRRRGGGRGGKHRTTVQDAAAAASMSIRNGNTELDRAREEQMEELWKALDDSQGIETHLQSSAAKPRVGLGLSTLLHLRASHAAILLSRAPAFPSPLLRTSQSKADVQMERCLEPLLHAARMTANDLTFAAAAASPPGSPHAGGRGGAGPRGHFAGASSVSYTHLTLPTIYSV